MEPPELSCDDPEHVLVEFIERVLRSAIASVATAIRNQGEDHRWLTDTDRHAGVVDVLDAAPGQNQWQSAGYTGHGTIEPRDHGARWLDPLDRDVAFDAGEVQSGQCVQPRVGPGANDSPLRRVGDPGVFVVGWRLVRVRVGPARCRTAVAIKEAIDLDQEFRRAIHEFPLAGPARIGGRIALIRPRPRYEIR